MLINNITVVDRYNRPNANSLVGLRTLFYNDGVLVDPVEIAGVAVFPASSNMFPESILNSNGIISYTTKPIFNALTVSALGDNLQVITNPLHNGINGFSSNLLTSNPAYPFIIRVGLGDYVTVLGPNSNGVYFSGTAGISSNYYGYIDGELDGSVAGFNAFLDGNLIELQTTPASSVLNHPGKYIDVWTVKFNAQSKYQTFINEFQIFSNTFTAITEPLLLNVTSKLINKHIQLGEKVSLKITNEIRVDNNNISPAFINTLKGSSLTSASIEIKKISDSPSTEQPTVVSSFANTAGSVYVTGDDTLVFNWDTSTLPTILSGNTVKGTYSVKAKFTLVDQIKITPPFYLIVS